jgi:hypothetical protein
MIILYDHIQELRAELRSGYFIRRERTGVEAELANAMPSKPRSTPHSTPSWRRCPIPPKRPGPPRRRPLPFSTALRELRDDTLLVLGIEVDDALSISEQVEPTRRAAGPTCAAAAATRGRYPCCYLPHCRDFPI